MQHTLQLRPQNLGLKSKYNRAVCHCHLSCSFTDISFVMLFSRSPPLAATTACSDWVDKLVEKKLGDRLKPAWVDKFRGLDPNAPMKYKQIPRRQTLSGIHLPMLLEILRSLFERSSMLSYSWRMMCLTCCGPGQQRRYCGPGGQYKQIE